MPSSPSPPVPSRVPTADAEAVAARQVMVEQLDAADDLRDPAVRPAAYQLAVGEDGEQHVHAGQGRDHLSWTLPARTGRAMLTGGTL